jgi:CRP-like cAMP-binding protein
MEEPVFESLDDALEWCEEQLLYEIGSSAEADASSSTAPPSSSPSNSPSRKSQPVPPKPPKPPLSKLLNPQLMSGRSSSQGRGSDPTEGGDAQMVDPLSRHPSYYFGLQQSRISPTSSASLAATAEGGALSSSSAAAVAERPMPPTLGSPMALVSILEDYLQIAPAESPLRTAAARTALATHFERATFQPGDVLLEAGRASDRLFLIERGTVDLVIIAGDDRRGRAVAASSSSSSSSSSSRKIGFDGKEGSRSSASIAAAAAAAAAKGEAAAAGRYAAAAAEATDGERGGNSKPSQRLKRLQRISGGGICGELGFFLEAPQAFSAVAVRPTAVWTLSRRQFTDMQVADAQLCILVQMALVKSLALSASQNLEGTRHRQLTEG